MADNSPEEQKLNSASDSYEQQIEEQVDYEEGGDEYNQTPHENDESIEDGKMETNENTKSEATDKKKTRKEFPIVDGVYPNILFLSRFGASINKEDIRAICDKYGPTLDISVKGNIAFVDFENAEDAAKAKAEFHHQSFLGSDSLICDFKKCKPANDRQTTRESFSRRNGDRDDRGDVRDRPRESRYDRDRLPLSRDERSFRDEPPRRSTGDLRDGIRRQIENQEQRYAGQRNDPRDGPRDVPRESSRDIPSRRLSDARYLQPPADYRDRQPVARRVEDDYRDARPRPRPDDDFYRGGRDSLPPPRAADRDLRELRYTQDAREPPRRDSRDIRDDRDSRDYRDDPRYPSRAPPAANGGSGYSSVPSSYSQPARSNATAGGPRYEEDRDRDRYASHREPHAPAPVSRRDYPPAPVRQSAPDSYGPRSAPSGRDDHGSGKRYDSRLDAPLQSDRRPPGSAPARARGYDDRDRHEGGGGGGPGRYDHPGSGGGVRGVPSGPAPSSRGAGRDYDDYGDQDSKRRRY